ncbi:MAG: aminoacyl-tRNA hydrolase [Gammaproteobacteria bacterium]|nr:aminoacyl-tRNA hydrolase [Gammaproteobacteria bacterium]NKB65178.1 aminoacyl-tRNA hydrolase [Gammaproteobacteria bacterium]
MLRIKEGVYLPSEEINLHPIRAEGAGGQHVNKVSTAIHLRFDIGASSLPDSIKKQLYQLNDQRISREGVIVIKAQNYRSQLKNRMDAQQRLVDLIVSAIKTKKQRKITRPTKASRERRLEAKKQQSQLKRRRHRVDFERG